MADYMLLTGKDFQEQECKLTSEAVCIIIPFIEGKCCYSMFLQTCIMHFRGMWCGGIVVSTLTSQQEGSSLSWTRACLYWVHLFSFLQFPLSLNTGTYKLFLLSIHNADENLELVCLQWQLTTPNPCYNANANASQCMRYDQYNANAYRDNKAGWSSWHVVFQCFNCSWYFRRLS